MTSIDERVAVLESLSERNEKDANELFRLLREHMEKEENDRTSLHSLINAVNNRISDVDNKINGMKNYVLGAAFIIGIVWVVGTKLVSLFGG